MAATPAEYLGSWIREPIPQAALNEQFVPEALFSWKELALDSVKGQVSLFSVLKPLSNPADAKELMVLISLPTNNPW